MPSTLAPSDGVVVRHHDGVSAVARAPRLVADGGNFSLVAGDWSDGPFAFADLIGRGAVGGHHHYALKGRPGWRLDIADPVPAELAARLPRAARYGGFLDRTGLWGGAAVCAVLACLFVVAVARTPSLVARLMPASVERRLGAVMVGNFGNRTCRGPGGEEALAALIARLGPEAAIADVRVVNVPIVNAVTLPGGHVLVFDGLIRRADSADEVAGVVAHELGHVAHRDVLASLVRQLGLSVVLGGLGGDVGGWVNALLAAGYSREAEGRADGYAIAMLGNARISSLPTANFFARLATFEVRNPRAAALLGYLASHPLSDSRRKRFAEGARGAHTPAITPAQWTALRDICRTDRGVSRSEFRF